MEKNSFKHIDLFSGIGGFAYAVDQVWESAEHIFCDIDPFCQQVLKKHWPKTKIYGDIRQLITDTESWKSGEQAKQKGWKDIGGSNCDLLTGGFPCQPFSNAGRRKGTEDNRYLWPEMFRIIQNTKPKWVIAENVRGLVTWSEGMVLEQVCSDLESESYKVQPLIIPAIAKNAPHRRDRIWIIANRQNPERRTGEFSEKEKAVGTPRDHQPSGSGGNAPNPGGEKPRGISDQHTGDKISSTWEQDWPEVATELCGVDDGVSAELDGFKLTKQAHRRERLKGLGNAIVPQVAIEIMRAIRLAN